MGTFFFSSKILSSVLSFVPLIAFFVPQSFKNRTCFCVQVTVRAGVPDVVGSFDKNSVRDKKGTTLRWRFELLPRIILIRVRVFWV